KGRAVGDFTATLAAGLLPFKLEYFNGYGKPELGLAWSGAGFDRRPLSRHVQSGDSKALLPDSREVGQTWGYSTAEQLPGWERPEFNTDRWRSGIGGFGTRGTPGAVVRTNWRTPAIYLRKEFTIEQVPPALALVIHHDEDVEVYLNGAPVYQANGFVQQYT